MAREHLRSHLSGEELSLDQVWDWYEFQGELIGDERVRTLDALRTGAALDRPRYFGMTCEELIEFFDGQRDELKSTTMLSLLAASEAALRVDYLVRVMNRKKDEISRKLCRALQATRAESWLGRTDPGRLEDTLHPGDEAGYRRVHRGVRLRHWLAHGRYWKPRLGQDFDPQDVLEILSRLAHGDHVLTGDARNGR